MTKSTFSRERIVQQMQGAMALQVAFVGIANSLFTVLAGLGEATAQELAGAAGVDGAYVARWCDAAFAYDMLDEKAGRFSLNELGDAFRPEAPETLMPFAVQSVLSGHMAERAAELMPSGERPGERVLAERTTILPWFGPMLEALFSGVFEEHILPGIPAYREVDTRGGVAVDLGCGNGWYLRRLAARYPHLRGIGLDGFEENIAHATRLADAAGLSARLAFQCGDIHNFNVEEPVDLIAMNRAMHHVWDDREHVFGILATHLKAGGAALIWEPNWPRDRAALRDPSRRGMAFQNLAEHVQGNHFLRPEQIAAEFHKVGMKTEVYLFANDNEAVIAGFKE